MTYSNESILDLLNRLHGMVPALLDEVTHETCNLEFEPVPDEDCAYCTFRALSNEIQNRKVPVKRKSHD